MCSLEKKQKNNCGHWKIHIFSQTLSESDAALSTVQRILVNVWDVGLCCFLLPEWLYVMKIFNCMCIPSVYPIWMCAYDPPYTWKTLFMRHFENSEEVAYTEIPACWSNGTVGKATIVVVTMKRLSSMALREKCTQFVFCPSLFLTLSVTFPSTCPYILPLWPPCSPQPRPSSALLSSHRAPDLALILYFIYLFFLPFIIFAAQIYFKITCKGHKMTKVIMHWRSSECIIPDAAAVIIFLFHFPPTLYFATMLTQSATLWPMGVLRVTVHTFDQMSQGWKCLTRAWNNLERQRMALIILPPCWKDQRMC